MHYTSSPIRRLSRCILSALLYISVGNFIVAKPSLADDSLQRGKYLAAIAACASCHGDTYEGGRNINSNEETLIASNITPAVKEGVGNWSAEDVVKAVRSRISRDATILSPKVHNEYKWMADKDAYDIAYFLKSLKAVNISHSKNPRASMNDSSWMPFSEHKSLPGYMTRTASAAIAHNGYYLVTSISNCARCHSPTTNDPQDEEFLAGSEEHNHFTINGEESQAPNIRKPLGKEYWTLELLDQHLAGHNGTIASCPTPDYRSLTINDRKAIMHFLNSLE